MSIKNLRPCLSVVLVTTILLASGSFEATRAGVLSPGTRLVLLPETRYVGAGDTEHDPPPWLAQAATTPADSVVAAPGGTGTSTRNETPKSVRTGRRVGAIAGGIIGAGMGTFVALIGQAVCEYECPDGDAAYYVAWGGGGALVGAGVGYIVGSFFGSLVAPEDSAAFVDEPPRTNDAGIPPPARPRRSHRTRDPNDPPTGTVALEFIGGRFTDRPGHDPAYGGRISLLRHPSHAFSYGVEAGYLGLDPAVTSYALVARRTLVRPGLRPLFLLAFSVNRFGEESTLIGGVVGAGVEASPRPGDNAWRLEGRYNWNLQNSEFESTHRFRYVTFGLGYRFGW